MGQSQRERAKQRLSIDSAVSKLEEEREVFSFVLFRVDILKQESSITFTSIVYYYLYTY